MITVAAGVDAYERYHRVNSRPNTIRSFDYTLPLFRGKFGERKMVSLTSDEVYLFLEEITEGRKQTTRSSRAGHLSALFNFVADTLDEDIPNPCARGIIKKLFKAPRGSSPDLLDKEIVDEIIYTSSGRDRLILELMGRFAMRIGEVLGVRGRDLNAEMNNITIDQPKSGRAGEVVYVSQRIMGRLMNYVHEKAIEKSEKLFPRSYSSIYRMVRKAGESVGVEIRPHDFRRHAATQASRAGTPLEIVSKVMLRHADISTTQRYLGKISHEEASRAIEALYA